MATAKQLLEAIKLPASVIERSTMPILDCLLIQEGRILGTNLEITVSAPIHAEVECCVPSVRFTAALKSMKTDDEVILRMDEKNRLLMRGGRSRHQISTLPVGDYPKPQWIEANVAVGDPKELVNAVRTTMHAMAERDVRVQLNGIATLNGSIWGTDSLRLASYACAELPDNIIIPNRTVPVLVALLDAESVRYGLSERHLCIEADDYRLQTSLVNAKYLDVERFVPKAVDNPLVVNRKELLTATQSMIALCTGKFTYIEILVTADTMTLVDARNEQRSELSIPCKGIEMSIVLDARLLADTLSAMEGEDAHLSVSDPKKPFLLTGSNPKQRFVLMPARL